MIKVLKCFLFNAYYIIEAISSRLNLRLSQKIYSYVTFSTLVSFCNNLLNGLTIYLNLTLLHNFH